MLGALKQGRRGDLPLRKNAIFLLSLNQNYSIIDFITDKVFRRFTYESI